MQRKKVDAYIEKRAAELFLQKAREALATASHKNDEVCREWNKLQSDKKRIADEQAELLKRSAKRQA